MSWRVVSLDNVCSTITKGTTPTTLGYSFASTGVPFLRVQNIASGTLTLADGVLFIDRETNAALKRSQIQPGDVLLSIAGTIGRVAIVGPSEPPMNCNQAVAILRSNTEIHRPFIRQWLQSPDATKQMASSKVTGTISNLSLGEIGNFKVPLPPLAEQRRIAAILDKAEEIRAKRRATVALLDKLPQSIFLEMFGDPATNDHQWPTQFLKSLTSKIGSGSTPAEVKLRTNQMGLLSFVA